MSSMRRFRVFAGSIVVALGADFTIAAGSATGAVLSRARRLASARQRLMLGAVAAMIVGCGLAGGQVASARDGLSTLSPLSAGVQVAMAVHNGTITPASGGSDQSGPSQLGVLTNVKANAGSQPANEVPITANPNNGQQLLSGANDYSCSTIQGFYSSGNGGSSWTTHCLAAVSGGSGDGDPAVAYDTSGNSYIAGIDEVGSIGEIVFQKSTNNGGSWSSTAVAVLPLFAGGFADKEWMESDHGSSSPRTGALYISVTQFNSAFSADAISVSHSYDGGTTWGTVQVDPTQNIASSVDQFSDLAVASDGTVYVSWMRCTPNGPTGDCGGSSATMYFSKSTDGGVTWAAPKVIVSGLTLAPDTCGAFYGCVPGTSERVSDIPVIDVDPTNGTVYVAYYTWTGSVMQVRLVSSTNGGSTWGKAKKPFGGKNTNNQWLHWVSIAPNGSVGVTALQMGSGTTYQARASVHVAGTTGYKKLKTAALTSNTLSDGFSGGFIGDYTGNIWTGGVLHQSWPDTRTGVSADETGGVTTP